METLIQEPTKEELTKKGFTNRIKVAEGQTKESLLAYGFTNHNPDVLYFVRMVADNISFNLSLDVNTLEVKDIDILDERFLQTYDYQQMILDDEYGKFQLTVYHKVNELLQTFQNDGIITGFEKGMYI